MAENTVNIFAPELRNKIRKELDFIPGAWVDFWDDITAGMVTKAQASKETQDVAGGMEIILSQIADWNFADDKGVLPITMQSLQRLPTKYLTWMADKQTEILNTPQKEDAKKNSPAA